MFLQAQHKALPSRIMTVLFQTPTPGHAMHGLFGTPPAALMTIHMNEVKQENPRGRRLSVAPMMDWTEEA